MTPSGGTELRVRAVPCTYGKDFLKIVICTQGYSIRVVAELLNEKKDVALESPKWVIDGGFSRFSIDWPAVTDLFSSLASTERRPAEG
jgi:hypothetical protein